MLDQTQKGTDIMNILGSWPRLDGFNFLGVRTNALLINDMPQVLNLLLSEAGYSFTHVKLLPLQRCQNQTHMRLMFSFSPGENQNIINVDNNKLSDIRMKIEFITV
jgi:hypothetical protein